MLSKGFQKPQAFKRSFEMTSSFPKDGTETAKKRGGKRHSPQVLRDHSSQQKEKEAYAAYSLLKIHPPEAKLGSEGSRERRKNMLFRRSEGFSSYCAASGRGLGRLES